MNRFTAAGLAIEAATEGKTITVIVPRMQEVVKAMDCFASVGIVQEQATIERRPGASRVSFRGGRGRIRVVSARQGCRGFVADLIFIEEDVPRHVLTQAAWDELYRDAQAVISGSRNGEIIIG